MTTTHYNGPTSNKTCRRH